MANTILPTALTEVMGPAIPSVIETSIASTGSPVSSMSSATFQAFVENKRHAAQNYQGDSQYTRTFNRLFLNLSALSPSDDRTALSHKTQSVILSAFKYNNNSFFVDPGPKGAELASHHRICKKPSVTILCSIKISTKFILDIRLRIALKCLSLIFKVAGNMVDCQVPSSGYRAPQRTPDVRDTPRRTQ